MSSLFGIAGGGNVGAAGGGGFYGYSVGQSLRLDGSTAYLSKSNFGTSTDTNKRTFSTWIKTGNTAGVAAFNHIIGAGSSGIDGFGFQNGTGKLEWVQGGVVTKTGTPEIRDTTAWYHFFTTWNAADNQLFIYVNGGLYYSDTGSLSALAKLGQTGHTTYIGKRSNASTYINGYLAETVFLDGYIGNLSDFGETVNEVWVPKNISTAGLTYGTNGFYLDYADSSDLGKDVSGQGNHFTSNNLGAEDQFPDSPNNNWPIMNELNKHNVSLQEGNLLVKANSTFGTAGSTFSVSSGKWYFEARNNGAGASNFERMIGIMKSEAVVKNASYSDSNKYVWWAQTGNLRNNSNVSYGDTWTADGDIIGIALDLDNGAMWFSKNGTWQASATQSEIEAGTTTNAAFTNLTDEYNFIISSSDVAGGSTSPLMDANFGQNPSFNGNLTGGNIGTETDANGVATFKYPPPSSFLALCSANLPEPAIGPNSGDGEQSDDYFNTVLYTGDGSSSNAITGVGFQPDWTWIKTRNGTASHALFDSVRGADNVLRSNGTDAENASAISTASFGGLTSFDSDGFTVDDGSDGTFDATNGSGDTYVSWNWKAGGAASTIAVDTYSSGVPSIASSVSAAPDAGFSIVSWVGTGANATIGHGLSEAPQLILVKNRDDTADWPVYNKTIGAGNRLYFNLSTNSSGGATLFNSTDPTNQVFSVGTSNLSNGSTDEMIALCFHSVEGYQKVGTYIGTGLAEGRYVHCGFTPKVLIVKSTGSRDWMIFDDERYPVNLAASATPTLKPNSPLGEVTTRGAIDFTSAGFKFRSSNVETNETNIRYVFVAIGSAPQKYALAR